jgi:hypothetical protein
MRRAGLALLLVLVGAGVGHTAQVICGDTQQFQRLYYTDPSQVQDVLCTVWPKPTSQAQRDAQQAQDALAKSFQASGTLYYLKVVNGLIEEKTQTEKDAVDTAIALNEAAAVVYSDELNNKDSCNSASLQVITSRMQTRHDNLATSIQAKHDSNDTAIDGIAAANLAALKQGLKLLNDTMAQGMNALNDRETADVEMVARCQRAARGRAN